MNPATTHPPILSLSAAAGSSALPSTSGQAGRVATETEAGVSMESVYHIPERPYSPIDALNRRAAALGSPGYAMATAGADYNGHRVGLSWNSYRGYYIAEYTWLGRQVIARGDFAACLAAVLREQARGALGSCAQISPREDDAEAIALCEATPELVAGDLNSADRSWYTWRHQCAAESARDCALAHRLVMLFDWELLQTAPSRDEYKAALKAKHGRIYAT